MTADTTRLACVHDVFTGGDADTRLDAHLAAARAAGAELAVLPELPLHPWSPATPEARDEDAEPPGGSRHARQAAAAKRAGIGLVGGAIVLDPETDQRHNTALVFDARGALVSTYSKVHIPDEPGFWEAHHYAPGELAPSRIDAFDMPFGLQICSDVQRPSGAQMLAALGAELIVVPRATPTTSYERWKLVLRANALTTACYVASVNRPGPEAGVPLGSPSLVIAPDGEILAETTDPVLVVELSREEVRRARRDYPGYLARPTGLYADGWRAITRAP